MLLDEFLREPRERDARRADAVDEQDFAACGGAPFVGADAAVGGGDVAGAGERGWGIGTCFEIVGAGCEGRAVDFVMGGLRVGEVGECCF